MSLEQLANLGEFLGGIAVIVSLVYLAVQVRRNTRATNLSAYQECVRASNDLAATIAQSGELARILVT